MARHVEHVALRYSTLRAADNNRVSRQRQNKSEAGQIGTGMRTEASNDAYNTSMNKPPQQPAFRKPSAIERVFNRCFGFLVGMGLGMKHHYLLQVHGRTSGKLYSNPIDLLEMNGRRFLVAPRGRTQWVRNAEAADVVTLKRGSWQQSFSLRAVPDVDKPALLKAYLDSFKTAVQRYFPVRAGSEPQAFGEIAPNYPVFELIAK